MTSAVRVDGLRELARKLREVDDGTADLKAANKRAADVVADDAPRRARRKSGRMARSVRAAGQQTGAVVRAGYASLPHVPVQHYGWPAHGISPNPFLNDAAAAQQPKVIEIYSSEVGKLVARFDLD